MERGRLSGRVTRASLAARPGRPGRDSAGRQPNTTRCSMAVEVPTSSQTASGDGPDRENLLARVALRFTAFTEKWLPDAYGYVLVGTFFVIALGLATGEAFFGRPADPEQTTGYGLVDAWGKGFWEL